MQRQTAHRNAMPPAQVRAHAASEFLTFRLGAESYGLPILRVQEIRRYERPTELANAPPWIKGVIDLRGLIVPILDLRIRFGLQQADFGPFTVVIIISVRDRVVGIVVDAVSDVCQLADDAIRPPPEFASATFDTRFITGLGTPEEGPMLILLDIETLMAGSEFGLMNDALQ